MGARSRYINRWPTGIVSVFSLILFEISGWYDLYLDYYEKSG